MITQLIELTGGYPDGVWTCPGCKAQLTSADLHGTASESVLDHADDCAEMAKAVAAERQRITRAILAQQQPCRDHPHPFPKPSCWTCARNGAFHRSAVIASGDTDPDGMPAGWGEMHEDLARQERGEQP